MKIEDIKKDIISKSRQAVFRTEADIYDVMNMNLRGFYGEYTPKEYIRTGNLGRSLTQKYSGLSASVYFDAGAMNYDNGVMPLQHTPEHGMYGWATWSGGKVLDEAMHGSHGGYVYGNPIWASSMAELGDIEALIKKNLKAAGL